MLSLSKSQVRSLVRELKSHKLQGMAKKHLEMFYFFGRGQGGASDFIITAHLLSQIGVNHIWLVAVTVEF